MSQTKAQLIDTLVASLLPASDSSVDIGSNAVRFANIYGDTLYGSGANLTALNIVTDTSPQLGSDLQSNGHDIDFADNDKAIFGTGSDFEIYHNGFTSIIGSASHTLGYYSGVNHHFLNANGTETSAKFTTNGSAELYYDNSKKFETTSGGVGVSGFLDIPSDSSRLRLGASNDLQIYHNGTINYIEAVSGDLQLIGNSSEKFAVFAQNGAVELYHDNSKKFETLTNGVQVTGSAIVDGTGTQTTTVTVKNGTDTDGTKLGHSSNSDRGFIQVTESGADFGIQVGGANTSNMRLELFGDSTTASRICLGTEEMITATPNGAVELYYDNSKKFETTSSGAHVLGTFEGDNFKVSNPGNNAVLIQNPANGIIGFGANNQTNQVTISADGHLGIPTDSGRLRLGASEDLQIYHDGTSNIILANSGDLNIRMNSSENSIVARQNGAAELYYDNSKKLETWTSGARLPSDNNVLAIGAGDDLRLWHNATNSIIRNATGQLQIQSNDLRLGNYNFTETYLKASNNGKVTLYYDNAQAARTESNGFAVLGEEGSDANLFFFADEADDNADQWRIMALASDSKLEFRNRDDGNYRINAEMVGSGHVKLYNDNNQRFATFAGGSIVYGQWRQAETNGNTRTMKTVVTNGLASGETLSFQDTSLNFHGFGEVTVILRHNSTSTQATMKKFPISIRSTANAGLGSEIFSINAATAGQSMTVTGTDRGVNVRNDNNHGCTCTVILDLIIFA